MAQPLKASAAKTHTVVVVWDSAGCGEERYLYKDTVGWYVWGYPHLCEPGKHYLTVAEDGTFEGVTHAGE